MEAILAWRAICSRDLALPFKRRKGATTEDASEGGEGAVTGMKDGRDVYVLRYETEIMLSTGRDVESWGEPVSRDPANQTVMGWVKALAAQEAIKMTVLSAYYMAIALPLYVLV